MDEIFTFLTYTHPFLLKAKCDVAPHDMEKPLEFYVRWFIWGGINPFNGLEIHRLAKLYSTLFYAISKTTSSMLPP